ncbi:MAG: tetratricopeptide repeat protein [Prevotella sp.]|nr:tetratricopeptide repeat protein [Prevotella sp.]
MVGWLFGLAALAQTGGVAASAAVSNDSLLRQYDVLFNEAMLQRQKGRHDATFDLLTRCLQLKPDASETLFFLAQYYTQMKQSDKALVCFERAAKLEPLNSTYMETLAQAYVGAEKYAEAITVVEKMYEREKGRQELLEMLYRLYIQEKDYAKAIGVLDRIEAIDGKNERTTLAKSGLYVQMDEHGKALAEVETLAKAHPNDPNYQTVYANALMVNGEKEKGLALLNQVLADDAYNSRALQLLRSYYTAEDDSVAVDTLTQKMLLNPRATTEEKVFLMRELIAETEQQGGDSTKVLQNFAQLMTQPKPDADIAELRAAYMDLKKMPRDSVAAALQQVLQIAPDRASARLHLVQFAWEANDNDGIIALCQAAREYNPEEMAFYYYQGMAYYRQEDTDHALEAFQNGINVINEDSSPEIVSDFYAVLGDLLFQKNREREAYAAYDSCLQWKPDNIGCLNNYAYYLSLKGERIDEAEQMSYKTIKAQPQNATYLDTYAWILFVQQRYAEARIYIDQALQNDSTAGAVVTEHAGDIYAQAGDIEGAIGLWQKALEQDPKNKILARKIKRKKYIKQ